MTLKSGQIHDRASAAGRSRRGAACSIRKGLPHAQGTRLRERTADLDRGQRHVLPLADAGDVSQMGERGAGGLRVRAQGPALCDQPARAQGGRQLDQALSRFRHNRTRRPSRAAALAIRADQEIRRRRFRRLSRTAAGQVRRPCAASRHRGAARQFPHGRIHRAAAPVRDAGRRSPTTPNTRTSPMSPAISSMPACSAARTRSPTAYPPKEIAAGRSACTSWADGKEPDDLPRVEPSAKASPQQSAPRDVFAYVIHEGKIRAPAGAMALIERLKD